MIARKYPNLSAAVLLALSGAASAADAPASAGLEEVVVTATKRETNAQTTPQSISAFSAEDLAVQQVNDIADLAMFTPGLFVGSDNGFGTTTTTIRGFGPLNLSMGGDEAVGIYIDGVYQGAPYGNQFTFIDVDQIEVLRGPQGTLYGRNATGGAILVSSVKPGPDTQVRADIGAGSFNSFEGRALVSGPVAGDNLYGKVAVGRTSRDGWANSPGLDTELNGEDNFNSSAGLRWVPGDVWDLALNVRYGTQDTTLAARNDNDGLPIDVIPAQFPNRTERDFGGATLNATANLSQATFTSITGYTNASVHSLTSSASDGLTQFLQHSKASAWYEEMRLSSVGSDRFTWLVGATATRQHASDVVDYVLLAKLVGADLGLIFDNTLLTTSYSGFVEAGWQVTDRLRLTAGTRYTQDEKEWGNCVSFGQFSNLLTAAVTPIQCNGTINNETRKWTASTPKAVIDFRVTDEIYAYASYNKGFRSGGWNTTSAVNPAAPYSTAFNPEYAESYEVGVKSELFDNTVRANVSVFQADYTDQQVRTIDPVFQLFGVRNAGSARTRGVELQVLAKPTSELTVVANAAWLDAVYRSFTYDFGGTPVDYSGNRLNSAPEWSYNLSVAYEFALPERGTLTPRVDASYQSRVYYIDANIAPYEDPGHEAINAHLRYEAASGRWGWDAYVNNVTDKQWRQYAYQGQASVVGVYYSLPRIAGIRFFWNQ
jgi:iron complex outermembrane receptor protein